MKKLSWDLSVLCVLYVLSSLVGPSLQAADKDQAQPLVDRAIKAAGGEAPLTKLKAFSWKARGAVHEMGMDIAFTGDWAVQAPDHRSMSIESEVNGLKVKFVSVVNRDKGWNQVNGGTEEMKKEQLADAHEELYGDNLTRLVPLKNKELTLTPLAETKLDGRPVLGLKVSSKGHRDVKLFFDKETALLARSSTRVQDSSGKEVEQEVLYSNYKDVSGVKVPMTFIVLHEGKPFLEAQLSDCKLQEKLDDSTFAMP